MLKKLQTAIKAYETAVDAAAEAQTEAAAVWATAEAAKAATVWAVAYSDRADAKAEVRRILERMLKKYS